MDDTHPMQAAGGDAAEGAPDGTNRPAAAGESQGGASPNPVHGEGVSRSGFMGHGGQSGIAYHGPGQLGDADTDGAPPPNAATRDD